jgi:2-polyprenyl-3-methyl-5-hydroxy-6-metoxy-1,4-benzoquinol methylase
LDGAIAVTTNTQTECNLCGSTQHECVSDKDRDGQALRTAICTGCGLVFSDPIPTEQQLADYYATRYRKSYKGVDRPRQYHIYRAGQSALRRLDRIRSLVPAGGRVLDIGSGGGEFIYLMTKRGYRATGVEPDLGYGGFSIQEYGIDVRQAPLYAIDLPAGEFDLITTHHVVEHLRDPLKCFQRAHELLKPGGTFVVDVPNVESREHAPQNRFHYAHVHNFNPTAMEWMGYKAGFEVHPIGMKSTENEVRAAFVKSDVRVRNLRMEENYRHVSTLLRSHTTLGHYLSLTPWERLATAAKRFITEPHSFRGVKSGREILDALYGGVETTRWAA